LKTIKVARPAAILLLAGVLGLSSTAPLRGQGADAQLVEDFLTLELAGWRLPEPMEECLAGLRLGALEATPFGNSEMIDQPELVDPPGPFYRNVRVEPEPGDRRRRNVRFEWLVPAAGGDPRPVPDSFSYMLNAAGSDRGPATMTREPDRLVVRRECYGG
jgi:hypothetical protein